MVQQYGIARGRVAELRIRRREQWVFRPDAEALGRAEFSSLCAEHRGHTQPVHGGVSRLAERIPTGQFLASGRRRRVVLRAGSDADAGGVRRSEEHTSELQSLRHLVCRLLLEKKTK